MSVETYDTLRQLIRTKRRNHKFIAVSALWKRKPVVASAVGGIPRQVIHKLTGMLVHSVEGCAYQMRYLLANPDFARQLGENGREHVKENFLVTGNLKRYLLLFLIQQAGLGLSFTSKRSAGFPFPSSAFAGEW